MSFVRAGDYTRLEEICRIKGHQGGTIHQCNEEASACLEREIDILAMSEDEYQAFKEELARCWPSYMAYCLEQERE